jgi:hypothetical protein
MAKKKPSKLEQKVAALENKVHLLDVAVWTKELGGLADLRESVMRLHAKVEAQANGTDHARRLNALDGKVIDHENRLRGMTDQVTALHRRNGEFADAVAKLEDLHGCKHGSDPMPLTEFLRRLGAIPAPAVAPDPRLIGELTAAEMSRLREENARLVAANATLREVDIRLYREDVAKMRAERDALQKRIDEMVPEMNERQNRINLAISRGVRGPRDGTAEMMLMALREGQ